MIKPLFATGLVANVFTLGGCKDDAKSSGGGGGGGGPGAGKVASCNMPSGHSCREYRDGNLALGEDMLRKLCTGSGDYVFTSTACPTDKLVGTCTRNEGKDYFYDGYPIDAADSERLCKDGGGTYKGSK